MTENKESIPDMDGDVLFYFTYKPAESKKAETWQNDWTSDPLWKKLNAVKPETPMKSTMRSGRRPAA